jgi:hypothetical protein
MGRFKDGEDAEDAVPIKPFKRRAGVGRPAEEEEPFKSAFFTEEETASAALTLKHRMPADVVRELQAQGKVKYDQGRTVFSTTVAFETDLYIKQLGEKMGVKKGIVLDRIVKAMKATEADEQQPNKLDRMSRRRKS